MNYTDFIPDQYYYTEHWTHYPYIFKADNLERCMHLGIAEKVLGTIGDFSKITKCRLATLEEIIWFELCKKVGEYVERPVIIFSEEIY